MDILWKVIIVVKNQYCIECGARNVGRADKKFCCDQCRSQYNNRLNSDQTAFIRKINVLLKRNNRILKKLNERGSSRVHRDKLLKSGFNFNYFTNEYVTKKGKTYRFCYDQGYVKIDEYHYAVVERREYVE